MKRIPRMNARILMLAHFDVKESNNTPTHKAHEAFWLNHTHGTIHIYQDDIISSLYFLSSSTWNTETWKVNQSSVVLQHLFYSLFLGVTTVVDCICKIFSDAFDIRCEMMECSFVGGWHQCVIQIACGFVLVICYLSHHFYHIFMYEFDKLCVCCICFQTALRCALPHFCTYYT